MNAVSRDLLAQVQALDIPQERWLPLFHRPDRSCPIQKPVAGMPATDRQILFRYCLEAFGWPESQVVGMSRPALLAAIDAGRAADGKPVSDLQRVRQAVADAGSDAKPAQVKRFCPMGKKKLLDALRELEKSGEYSGFSRPRPMKYKGSEGSEP